MKQTYEIRTHRRDYLTSVCLYRNGKFVQYCMSVEDAHEIINSKSPIGRKLATKVKANNAKVKKLEQQICRLDAQSYAALQKLRTKWGSK